jgi:hypothetical protein
MEQNKTALPMNARIMLRAEGYASDMGQRLQSEDKVEVCTRSFTALSFSKQNVRTTFITNRRMNILGEDTEWCCAVLI